ncbi:MAG: hypothetical protein ACE5G9_03810 [Nitrospinales bacterium]
MSLDAHAAGNPDCGGRPLSIAFYEQVSYYSLALGFGLIFLATLLNGKKLKTGLFAASIIPFVAWIYVYAFLDMEQLKQTIFNYDLLAESTLANIAEGQERYKSEHAAYLKDLDRLSSHIAGSHGIDPCVKVLSIRTYSDHWTGVARHVSSPNKIVWDSRNGSSLKKG